MKSIALIHCLILLAGILPAMAADPNHPPGHVKPEPAEVLQLWPDKPPGFVAGGKPEAIVNERIRNVSNPQLWVYPASKEKSCGTSLIICPGGGYSHLAMCIHVENVVQLLNDRGITVFGLKYRTRYGSNDVANDALADGERAIRLIRSRAKAWNLDPTRIGIQGYSAGGNLVLNLISHFDEGDPQAADPIERLSSRPDFSVLMCAWPNQKPITEFPILKNAPPTWIASAKDDTTAPVAFSHAIADKLKSFGVATETFIVETGGHGAFHYALSPPPGGNWPVPFFEWLGNAGMLGKIR